MNKNYHSGTIGVIAGALTILFVLSGIIFLILSLLLGYSYFIAFIVVIVEALIALLPLYALANAIKRIDRLEYLLLQKKIIKNKDIYEEIDYKKLEANTTIESRSLQEIQEGEIDGITLCKKCGYQIFEEDEECPNCHTKIKK